MTRLLPAHVAALAVVCGLAASNAVRVHPPAALALAVGAALLAIPRGAYVALALVGLWWGSARLDSLDRSVLAPRVGTAAELVATTTAGARPGAFALRQRARVGSERVELELPLGRAPPQGAILTVLARIEAPRGPSDGFDERTWLRRQGIHVVLRVDRWRIVGRRRGVGAAADRLHAWLARASTPGLAGERRALVAGIVLGDDGGLNDAERTAFRRSGLYHLLAVSGQNVVLLAGGVLTLALALGIRRAWGHAGALAAIGAYVLAVGPQPSVVRAAVAGAAVSVAWLLGRLRDAWHVLLLAALVLLAASPYAIFDAGFQLSFAAVIAIFVLGAPLQCELDGYPLPAWLRTTIAISTASTVATAPLLWLEFGRVPLYGVLANALAEPAMPFLLGLAFAAAAADPVAPPLAEALAWLNGMLASYVSLCARLVSALPGAQVSGRGAALAAAAALAATALLLRALRTAASSRP